MNTINESKITNKQLKKLLLLKMMTEENLSLLNFLISKDVIKINIEIINFKEKIDSLKKLIEKVLDKEIYPEIDTQEVTENELLEEIEDYMELYEERFHIIPYKNNLQESEEKNSFLIEKYKKERETIKEFEKKNDFPKGSYPLEFDIFVKNLFDDILELEKLKENQEKIIIQKV